MSTDREFSDLTARMLLQILTYVARKLYNGHFRALRIKNDITEGDSIYSVEYIPFLTTMASLLISCLFFCAPIPCFSERRQRILIKSTAIESITKTYLYNFDPLKPHFYIVKLGFTGVYIIFLISAQNIDCGYSLEPPRRGGSNEYLQSMF